MERAETRGGGATWKLEGISPEIEEARAIAGITSIEGHYRALSRSPVVEIEPAERCPHSTCKVVPRSKCSMCRASLGEQLPISRPAVPLSSTIPVNAVALSGDIRECRLPTRKREPDPSRGMGGRGMTSESQIQQFLHAVDTGVPQNDPGARSGPRAHRIDDARLRLLWAERRSLLVIATQLGVSRETVRQRAIALGLHSNTPRTRPRMAPACPEGYVTGREARKRLGDRAAALKPHIVLYDNGKHERRLFATADIEQLEQQETHP